jgi:2-oxoglutarate/2-oxoacid ferredoxin oxidoreductase subunit beta
MSETTTGFRTFETAWCPGCGDHAILASLKETLDELGLAPHDVLVVGGIGQAAKTPQYLGANAFCGLHGRSLPPAAAAKLVNPKLTVIVDTGDGDSYGEGGNHFLHNIRRNVDITHFVHDNQIYGLTKGQASPTTAEGQVTTVQPHGSVNQPMNPLLVALSLGCGFVARAYCADKPMLKRIMAAAIRYRGYALVDILQPCVSFNKVNTYEWYGKRVYPLEETHDATDREAAFHRAAEWGDRIPLGIFFNVEKPTYPDHLALLRDAPPLVDAVPDPQVVRDRMEAFR